MEQIILNEKLSLLFEPFDDKVRLVFLQADKELVCRKETVKNLKQFLSTQKAHLFKGRLQLKKNEDVIEVLVKQNSTGLISANTFKKVLKTMSN